MYYKIINKKKKIVTIIADILGYAIWSPVNLFKKRSFPDTNIREILVIRTAYMGDVMMTVPILKPLKGKYPHARLSFLTSTKAKEILENNPYIDDILTYDPFWFYPAKKTEYLEFISRIRKKTFDLVIEARGDIRDLLFIVFPLKAKFKVGFNFGGGGFVLSHSVPYTGIKHKIEYHLDIVRYLGCKVEDIEWGVYLTSDEKNRIKEIMSEHGIKQPFISVHPGARHPLRRWFPERYAQLYDMIPEKYNIPIVILGAKGEEDLVDNIRTQMHHKPVSVAGKLTLRELSGILSESLLFICNNSGPMHIAASMKVPTVVIHGPSKSYWDAPYGNIHRIVEKDFQCRNGCDEDACNHQTFKECMEKIQVDDVLTAVREVFEEIYKKAARHEIQN